MAKVHQEAQRERETVGFDGATRIVQTYLSERFPVSQAGAVLTAARPRSASSSSSATSYICATWSRSRIQPRRWRLGRPAIRGRCGGRGAIRSTGGVSVSLVFVLSSRQRRRC
jgi:hypothetical protein